METDDTKGPLRMGTTAEPAANDTEQETAFFGPGARGCEADDQGPEDPGF